MAINNRLVMQTDTGGSSNVGAGKTNNTKDKLVRYNTPTTKTTTATTTAANTNAAAKKTSTAKTATTATTANTSNTANKKTYYNYSRPSYSGYSGYSGYSSGSSTAQAPAENHLAANINNYINSANDIFKNEYNTMMQNATDYNTAALQNLAAAENQYNTAYGTNKSLLDALEAQNKQREQSVLNTISSAYSNQLGNANTYYQNVLDAYNRSMNLVNQGFDEGNDATQRARDEAIELAAQIYQMGEDSQNRETEKALQSQYGSYMKGMRNMNQLLAAQGINGGASETAMLNALNGYESNRASLYDTKLAALGQLRQTQMQSDSEAQMNYLNKLADLISERTSNSLGVENTRGQGEYNYANMKNSAESERSSNTTTAQNNFQNWASNLTGQRTSNENAYAQALLDLANAKNDVGYNSTSMSNAAAQGASDNAIAMQPAVTNENNTKKNKKNKTTKSTKKSSSSSSTKATKSSPTKAQSSSSSKKTTSSSSSKSSTKSSTAKKDDKKKTTTKKK
jgi:hypothetical protein